VFLAGVAEGDGNTTGLNQKQLEPKSKLLNFYLRRGIR